MKRAVEDEGEVEEGRKGEEEGCRGGEGQDCHLRLLV